MDFDVNLLGRWPTDCFEQQLFVDQLEGQLNELSEFVEANASEVVILQQASEPSQGQWETAWTAQTGNPTPIPASAVLLWYNTLLGEFGGLYGTMTGFPTVEPRIAQFVRGMTVIAEVANDATARSSARSLYENPTLLPTITFTTYVTTTLILTFSFQVTTGNANAGADFLLDNVKVGTQFFAIQTNGGMIENPSTSRQTLSIMLPDISPGEHTVRPLLGVVGAPASPVAVGWGGATGVTSFDVKAIVQ